MMKRIHLVVLLAALLIGSVVTTLAVSELYRSMVPSSCEEFLARNSFIWLPSKVSDVFYGDMINLHFSMINGRTITLHGIVTNSAIVDLECGESTNYDYDVSMSDINALQLATSTTPTTTFVKLWRAGEIKIKANGYPNEMKLRKADDLVAQDDEPVPEWIRNIFSKYIEG